MSLWSNLIGYQLVWFIAVIGAGRGLSWPAVGASLLFVGSQLALSRQRWVDVRLIAAALVLGVLIDGTLAATGLMSYATASPALPPHGAPLWILAMWAAFAVTLPRALSWLQGLPVAGALFGAIGAPLAYLAAARGWDAVAFAAPAWRAAAALGAGWALAMVLLLGLCPRGTRSAA